MNICLDRRIAAIAGLGFSVLSVPVSAQSFSLSPVTVGSPSLASQVGVRYRAFNRPAEQEVYIGNNLGSGTGRSASNISFVAAPSVNAFSISYNATTDILSTTIGGTTTTWNWTALDPVSEVRIGLYSLAASVSSSASVTLSNLTLTGTTLAGAVLSNASISGAPVSVTSTGSAVSALWAVSGFDFGANFTLTGDLQLSGVSNFSTSAESSKVEVYFGTPATAVPEASTWAAIAAVGAAAALYAARRRR